ncbi:Vms1/Ankzf1 family peptidyl-tRNA hydrolase [Halovivax cerinus]|uniref:Vms1/Ankzf1 family peptidyl-tRNA hydrolase n=1 Tax=Halovivax cerinus TaxID=1487865 RepID=A0ABD5NIB2_9EURY|nr:Vms1/Ankzf1 family peptidyl-tRNA hydrolase [Halovivax cerinus]
MSKLDEWLGRASLRDRIDELETECDRLRERYEAESERRRDAVSARQDAEERVNRLEDRIAQLEGALERRDDASDDLRYRRRERLRGNRLEEVVSRLQSLRAGPESVLTASVEANGAPEAVASALDDRARLAEEAAPCLVVVDDAGLVSIALDGPLATDVEPTWSDRVELDPAQFQPTGPHLLALARADLFAIGRYDGTDRVQYAGFESDVKGAHSKGGFSQARFERIRAEQIDDHVAQATAAIEDVRDEAADLPLYLVGQRDVLDDLADELDQRPDAIATVDATGDPESALEDAHRAFWTTELLGL